MICPHCGQNLPDDKKYKFCTACGGTLDLPQEAEPPQPEQTAAPHTPEPMTAQPEPPQFTAPPVQPEPPKFTAPPVQPEPPKFTAPPVQPEPPKFTAPPTPPVTHGFAPVPPVPAKKSGGSKGTLIGMIIAIVLAVVFLGTSIFFGITGKQKSDRIQMLKSRISASEEAADAAADALQQMQEDAAQQQENLNQAMEYIEQLEQEMGSQFEETLPMAEAFSNLIVQCYIEDFGYGSDLFYVSDSVVVVSLSEGMDGPITLYTLWDGSAQISWEADTECAGIVFDEDSWSTEVGLTVVPNSTGVSVITLTNDYDNTSFSILAIVVE